MNIKNIVSYVCIIEMNVISAFGAFTDKSLFIYNEVSTVTNRIIHSCFKNRSGNALVITNKNDNHYKIVKLFYNSLIPFHLVEDNNENIFEHYKGLKNDVKINDSVLNRKLYPATKICITVSSPEVLKSVLQKLKHSIWWNEKAYFLLVSVNPDHYCTFANSILQIIWSFNIVYVVYLCSEAENRTYLFTFNPYSKLAPQAWSQVLNNEKFNDHGTLLVHYVKNPDNILLDQHSFCKNLFFNKMKNLNGFNVKAVFFSALKKLNNKETDLHLTKYISLSLDIFIFFINAINATVTVKIARKYGIIDDRGEPHGPMKDVMLDGVDAMAILMFQKSNFRSQTYPHLNIEYKAVTLKTRLSNEEKINLYFPLKIFLISELVRFIFVFFFKYLNEQNFTLATLDVLRTLVGLPTGTQPKSFLKRIWFIFLVINIYFCSLFIQSYVCTFFTVVEFSSLIDSAEDVVNSNLTIIGIENIKNSVYKENITNNYEIGSFNECVALLKNGNNRVCLENNLIIKLTLVETEQLHISKSPLFQRYLTYIVKEDWALLDEFNNGISKYIEGGFVVRRDNINELYEKEKNNEKNMAMNMDNQTLFSSQVYLLSGGWILSIFTFTIEIIFNKLKFTYFWKNPIRFIANENNWFPIRLNLYQMIKHSLRNKIANYFGSFK